MTRETFPSILTKSFRGIATFSGRLMRNWKRKRTEILPCMGVKVIYDEDQAYACRARGIWFFTKISVGPTFFRFPPREQMALLVHEVGHCRLRHIEARLRAIWLLFWDRERLFELCVEQENEADRFAQQHGYGADLGRALAKFIP